MMTLIILSLISTLADGDAAAARSDWREAARFYQAELDANPQSYDAKYKLARALSFSGKREEAIELYTQLLAASPDNTDVLIARGRVYAWEKRWAESEADLLAATKKSPNSGDAWSALGDMYSWSDRPEEAIAAYDQWVAVAPDNPAPRLARAKAYTAAGQYDNAEAELEAARARGADPALVEKRMLSMKRKQAPDVFVPEEYKWSARIGYQYTEFSPDRVEWNEADVTIRRHWDRASLGVEYLYADRFDRTDDAFALDAYVDVWPRAYANLRFQYSPDNVLFPDYSYRAEIWQGVGKGWEPSISYDHLKFGNNGVDLYGVGLGKYFGNFYLRWKTLFIPSTARLGTSHRALGRYYFAGNADDYFELNGGFSRGGEFVRRSNLVIATKSFGFGAAVQKYFTPRWGLKFSAGYSDDQATFVERSYGATLLTRW